MENQNKNPSGKKNGSTHSTKKKRPKSPLDELRSNLLGLEQRFENLIDNSPIKPPKFDWPEWTGLESLKIEHPKVDILDCNDSILIRAEIPGVKKDDVDLSLSDTTFTLHSRPIEETDTMDKDQYYHRETASKSFSRTLVLPCDIQSSDAKAHFENGLLEISAPKSDKTKSKTIQID